MKTKKILIISIIVITVIALLIAVLLFAKMKKKKALLSIYSSPKTAPNPSEAVVNQTSSSAFPLSLGTTDSDNGEEVTNLQKYLNYYARVKGIYYPVIKVNGSFGSDTLTILQKLWGVEEVPKNVYDATVMGYILNNV
jgi:hypothetical protein